MLLATRLSDTALVLAAGGVFITGVVGSVVSAIATLKNLKRTDEVILKVTAVDGKVDTLNESTIGQLGADDETRRIAKLDPATRTEQERRHLRENPPPERPPYDD